MACRANGAGLHDARSEIIAVFKPQVERPRSHRRKIRQHRIQIPCVIAARDTIDEIAQSQLSNSLSGEAFVYARAS
jgi:hypothetical protein